MPEVAKQATEEPVATVEKPAEVPVEAVAKVAITPWDCVPVKTHRYAVGLTEAHLSNKGGNVLSEDFAHFVNLSAVWLNRNKLESIDNLQANKRIKELYLQDNLLTSIVGLSNLVNLEVLVASGNRLANLSIHLPVIEKLERLKALDLSRNPCASEPRYSELTLTASPNLERFDGFVITDSHYDRAIVKLTASPRTRQPKAGRRPLSLSERDVIAEAAKLEEARLLKLEDRRKREEANVSVYKAPYTFNETQTLPRSFRDGIEMSLKDSAVEMLQKLIKTVDPADLLKKLKNDEYDLGRTPPPDVTDVSQLIGTLPKWVWRSSAQLQVRIDGLYREAAASVANPKAALDLAARAARLETVRDRSAELLRSEGLKRKDTRGARDVFKMLKKLPDGRVIAEDVVIS